MIGSLIVAAAMMGQVPPARAKAGPTVPPRTEANKLIEKRKAKKSAAYARRLDGEAKQAVAEQKALEAARKEYKEMLPYMLEQQRQMLERQSAAERNAALDRMARAAESQASSASAATWALYRNQR